MEILEQNEVQLPNCSKWDLNVALGRKVDTYAKSRDWIALLKLNVSDSHIFSLLT